VAPVAAATFLGSVGDPQSYHSSRQVLALAGLSLTTNSSGERQGRDRISKEGRPLIRRLAFMLGLRAVRTDGLYRAQYEGLLKRNGKRKLPAVVAIGRKVLRLMFSVARAQRAYTAEPPSHEKKAA
jgi:transposase